MRGKTTAILMVIVVVLGFGALYLAGQNNELLRRISSDKDECERRAARLRNDYQGEIEDLRSYIRERYEYGSTRAEANAGAERIMSQADKSLLRFVERKYQYLLDELALNEAGRERLMQLLSEREHTGRLLGIARNGDDSAARESIPAYERRLAEIDEEIGTLLGVTEVQAYEMLKDSDIEQHHLSEYTESITHAAPIGSEQAREILFTKLRHKQIFETVLGDAGFYRDRLSHAEREHASAVISQALDDYRNNFLQDIQGLLAEEQFILLKNYENVEFNWEKERLLQQIDSKR